MFYYGITIENYFETLVKSKPFKHGKPNSKTLKNFTKKLNKIFHKENNDFLKAYVFNLDENTARVLGAFDERVKEEQDVVRYVVKMFNMPAQVSCDRMDEEDYKSFMKKALIDQVLPKKVAKAYDIDQRLKAYCRVDECENTSANNAASSIEKSKSPYQELRNLIGLVPVKGLANQIIASTVMDKKRSAINGHNACSSKHMIFTGEPGSAKTTAARLLAGALKEKGALETGAFVECGRQDLVGKYTGWTATQVAEKFEEAKGGVLFIDEAYSLVSKDDFGTEAINTIVQEMENHREDVIVIFAGYPDKMERFLNENQGLKSRIAFYVDFPNYNVDELIAIFKKMLNDQKYTMDEDGINVVKEICEAAHKVPDFGNGRFVRNIFEQAVLKQSERLFATYGAGDVPADELFTLRKEDINLNYTPFKDEEKELPKKASIGFVA